MFYGVIIKDVEPVATSSRDGAVTFVGNYSPYTTSIDKTVLYLGSSSTLYWPNAEMTFGAFRAHFQLNNGLECGENDSQGQIKSYALRFGEGNETGISLINDRLPRANDAWYTIDGRKLPSKPAGKGVYINNGHKVVIK